MNRMQIEFWRSSQASTYEQAKRDKSLRKLPSMNEGVVVQALIAMVEVAEALEYGSSKDIRVRAECIYCGCWVKMEEATLAELLDWAQVSFSKGGQANAS